MDRRGEGVVSIGQKMVGDHDRNADESVSLTKIAGTKCLSTVIFCDPAGGFYENAELISEFLV